jgi:hypothetical protein
VGRHGGQQAGRVNHLGLGVVEVGDEGVGHGVALRGIEVGEHPGNRRPDVRREPPRLLRVEQVLGPHPVREPEGERGEPAVDTAP